MRRLFAVLVPLASVVVAACSSASPASGPRAQRVDSHVASSPSTGSAAPASSAAAAARALPPWHAYHHGSMRSGFVAKAPASPLHQAWSRKLGDAVYGEPLVVGDTLIVATEGNDVFGLNARTGVRRWKVHLGTPQPLSGLPCGNIDPLGITGTPAFDRHTGSVFVVAETVGGHHTLWALNAATGHRRWHRTLDVLPNRNRMAEQQRPAALVAHGRVLVSFGGLAGDCDNYVGYVTSTSVRGTGRTFHYAVPTLRRAGMWATPGPVRGRNGHVYVSAGNSLKVKGRWDKSDSVTELTARRLHRLSAFAPATWRNDNARDLDLGSSSPTMVPALKRIVIAGKRGVVYLLRERLGGVGSAITTRSGCNAFGGSAVTGRTVLMPCLGQGQVRALRVGSRRLHWTWSANVYGSPVIAGSRVYVTDRDSGDLFVLRLSDGRVVQRLHAGSVTHFPSQAVSGNFVFVPTLTGITAFRG